MKRVAVTVIAAIAGISVFLLTSASANTKFFADVYPYVLALNGAVVAALATLVGLQLRALWREYRERRFGSRLKYRLLLMFALIALVPGAIVYAVSLQFVVKSIDSWFDVRVDRALEGGVALGQTALDYLVSQVVVKAREAALEFDSGGTFSSIYLNNMRERIGVDSIVIVSAASKPIVAVSGDITGLLLPDMPSFSQLRQARQMHLYQTVDTQPDGALLIRVVVPIPTRSLQSDIIYLQLTQRVPESFSRHVDAVQEAHRDYQQLVLARQGLSRIYSLTLTLTLLLALLSAVAVAFVLARRFIAPLLILSEGTRAVAQGDFSPRQALPLRDELGVLLNSFNRMTQQLKEARIQADKNRAAVESSRAFLESILVNLSTGVLAFGADGRLRAANPGALQILQDDFAGFEEFPIEEWPRHTEFRDALLKGFTENSGDWHEQFELCRPDNVPQILLIHGARLPQISGGGVVVVFDDLTHMVMAQRTAAWAEVARRMAHEIKNPLTPIQLSAERLAYKLSDRLDAEGREMLERATRTIVNQVETMKNLVNAFRDYAKLPSPTLRPLDLNALIADVLNLYESSSVCIETDLDSQLPMIIGDGAQLGQILHNLMQNAEDALAESADGRIIIMTRRDDDHATLTLRDNGPGFPAELLARAFEPYFTTKSRGSGLGLAIVKKIVDEHGGQVRLSNRDGGGAEVCIRLRVAEGEI